MSTTENLVIKTLALPGGSTSPATPFDVNITEDILDHSDDATNVSLRDALTQPSAGTSATVTFNKSVKGETIILDTPLSLEYNATLQYKSTMFQEISGEISTGSHNLTMQRIDFTGNLTAGDNAILTLMSSQINATINGGTIYTQSAGSGTSLTSFNRSVNCQDIHITDTAHFNDTVTTNSISINGTGTFYYEASLSSLYVDGVAEFNKSIFGLNDITLVAGSSMRAKNYDFTGKNLTITEATLPSGTYDDKYDLVSIENAQLNKVRKASVNGTLYRINGISDFDGNYYKLSHNTADNMLSFVKASVCEVDKEYEISTGFLTLGDAVENAFDVITFSDDLNNGHAAYDDGLTLNADSVILGKGPNATSITGSRFFAAGHFLEIKDASYTGTLLGGSDTSVSDCSITLTNSTVTAGSRIYGGGYLDTADASQEVGDVLVCTQNACIGQDVSLYGAGFVNANNGSVSIQSITLELSTVEQEARSGNIYAGAYIGADGGNISVDGPVNTSISSGYFHFTGNGTRTISGSSSSQGESTLMISGGKFDGPVYAGAYSMGGEAIVNGNTHAIISGGSFTQELYGGCGANKAANGCYTIIDGSASITIECGSEAIHFGGHIFTGSYGAGTILGADGVGTSLSFTGNGDVITWGADSRIYGCCQLSRASITGRRILTFDGFTNSQDFGTLQFSNGFDSLCAISSSDVTFHREATLDGISTWELEAGSTLTWAAEGSIDLDGDTLNITGLSEGMADCVLLSGCQVSNWEGAQVTFNNGDACACAGGAYSDSTYRLWLENGSVKVGLATVA